MYQFRDPIHGFIDVSEDELRIINSPPFQRLRNIRQLATTYLVYHGAEHTRFGHSIGVMHLVTRAFDAVTDKISYPFSDDIQENDIILKWYRQLLRIIGLTHDLGHAPFSHASEALFENGLEHEDYTKKIILETEIREHINEIGRNFQRKYGEKYEITPELVWMIYEGKNVLDPKYIIPDFMFLKSFMDGELDCDKMDYRLRDSKFCGVSYGNYDLERFISTLTVYKDDKQLQLAVEKGGIQALEEFILARYFMFIQVYYHKTRRYLDKLLVKSLQEVLPGGKYPVDLQEYLLWDDARVLSTIAQTDALFSNAYRRRDIMPCVYESPVHARKDPSYNLYVNILKKEFDVDSLEFDQVDKAAHKLSPSLINRNDDSGKGIVVIEEKTGIPSSVMDVSVILQSLVNPINIKRIYAKKDDASAVRNRIKELQQ